jgi:hypothetical protein
MRTTARFELERKNQLKQLFTRSRLVQLWRSLVKDQMRKFDITDLHDYYDFNFAIEARADAIIERVLTGQYRAEVPLVYRIEKKLGVCRHMMIPTPSDALVFQLLTDVLYNDVIQAQPSKSSFYARDRHTLTLPHEQEEAASYPWFILWPKFQKEIWKFAKAKKFLVTTDLTNYFDNISLRELRHVISAIVHTPEVYLDLMFSLIEDLSWTPDYLPPSGKGLPTIHIEAPRLLAHALLFEVDYVLKQRTGGNFVRWMDDINFGVDQRETANVILGEVNEVLKSRGLALNLAKTEIMTRAEARQHFVFEENVRLNGYQQSARRLKTLKAKQNLSRRMAKEFARHVTNSKARNKDKLTKRYLSILGILGVPTALALTERIYLNNPALRDSVLRYLSRLPFTASVANTFIRLSADTPLYDDVARFAFVRSIISWQVPLSAAGKRFVAAIQASLDNVHTSFDWFCYLVFLTKYGQSHEVLNAANQWRKFGAKEPYFSRQRMAALARGLEINAEVVFSQWSRETSTGSSDSASVSNNLLGLATHSFPAKRQKLYFYLFPDQRQVPYPLPKFLILCILAHAERRAGKKVERPMVTSYISDPWYRHWLSRIHPAWFS